jgi:hypothetical protein
MENEGSQDGFGGGPARFLTLKEMADEVGTSKSYVSRRARSGKDVRGVPVSEMAVKENGRLAGFEVPRGVLDDEPEKGRENDASDDISGDGDRENADEEPVTDERENAASDSTGENPQSSAMVETDDSGDAVPVLLDEPRENSGGQLVQALGVLGASVVSAYALRSFMPTGGDGRGLGETDRRTIGEVAREVQAGDWPCDASFHFRIPWTSEVSGIGFTDFTVKRRLEETADSFETVSWNWAASGVGSWGGFRVRGEDVPAVARRLDAIRQTAPDKMGAVELRDVNGEATGDGYNCFRPQPQPDDRGGQQQTTGRPSAQQAGAFGSTANRVVIGVGGTFLLGSLAFVLLDDAQK